MLNAALMLYAPVSNLSISMEQFVAAEEQAGSEEDTTVSIDPNDGNFEPLIPDVISVVHMVLNDLGALSPDVRKFAFSLVELDRFLKSIPAIQRTGSPGFWINNLQDILEMIRDVRSNAEKVLQKIEGLSKV